MFRLALLESGRDVVRTSRALTNVTAGLSDVSPCLDDDAFGFRRMGFWISLVCWRPGHDCHTDPNWSALVDGLEARDGNGSNNPQ